LPLKVVETQQPTPPEKGIPREYFYAGAAIVVIVIIAITGYAHMKSRKK
jgi:hypothetical protein